MHQCRQSNFMLLSNLARTSHLQCFVNIKQRLQHTATHCNTLQPSTILCQHQTNTATHCNSLQHAATIYNTLSTSNKEETSPLRDIRARMQAKQYFDELRSLLPCGAESKFDKNTILQNTIAMIKQLQVSPYYTSSPSPYPSFTSSLSLSSFPSPSSSPSLNSSTRILCTHAFPCGIHTYTKHILHRDTYSAASGRDETSPISLQHAATLCTAVQCTATHATHCTTLHHFTTHCHTLHYME